MFLYDSTYILIVIGIAICMLASANVKRTFRRYREVRNRRNYTAEQAAMQILHNAGIYDVTIECVRGELTDHYDPRSKVLRLSETVYGSTSVAAIGVAAHECGHAVQHANGYMPLRIRGALVPVVNIGSQVSPALILLGFFLGYTSLVNVGILLFALVLVFQIVTLPVEFNASGRALRVINNLGILYDEEQSAVKKVLGAAALTYVASVLSTALQLLRLVLLSNRRK